MYPMTTAGVSPKPSSLVANLKLALTLFASGYKASAGRWLLWAMAVALATGFTEPQN